MNKSQILPILVAILFIQSAFAFDFEVDCDDRIANERSVSEYFQKYIGNWTGEWEEDEYLRFSPDRIKNIAANFDYQQIFEVGIVSVRGCEVSFGVYYEPDKNDFTHYDEEVMTDEGLYIYWNSPTINGTYILVYDEERDILDGTLQLFEGQNIASIEMRRM